MFDKKTNFLWSFVVNHVNVVAIWVLRSTVSIERKKRRRGSLTPLPPTPPLLLSVLRPSVALVIILVFARLTRAFFSRFFQISEKPVFFVFGFFYSNSITMDRHSSKRGPRASRTRSRSPRSDRHSSTRNGSRPHPPVPASGANDEMASRLKIVEEELRFLRAQRSSG